MVLVPSRHREEVQTNKVSDMEHLPSAELSNAQHAEDEEQLSLGEGALLFHSFNLSLFYTFSVDEFESMRLISILISGLGEYLYGQCHPLFICLAALSNRLCKRGMRKSHKLITVKLGILPPTKSA